MQYVEAPHTYNVSAPSVFLAGGITGTAPWQTRFAAMLCDSDWVVVNPRRHEYAVGDARLAREQIRWEHEHLERASLIAFWFCGESMCPITLFELGAATRMDRPILVGAPQEYARRFDLEEQLQLRRPEVTIVDRLDQLARQVKAAYRGILSRATQETECAT